MKGGAPDKKHSLRLLLNKEMSSRTPAGGAYRWAIGATAEGALNLQLHGVALPAATVNARPNMLGDDVPVHVAATFQLEADMFNGSEGVRGPVPLLFAEQPEDLRTHLSTAAAAFVKELSRFHKRFLLFISLPVEKAKTAARKGTKCSASTPLAYSKPPKSPEPSFSGATKRPRLEEPVAGPSTGNFAGT